MRKKHHKLNKTTLYLAALLAVAPLAACEKQKTIEEVVAEAKENELKRYRESIELLSDSAQLHGILAALAERPELKDAQFGPVDALNFDFYMNKITVNIRSSRAEKLAGYTYLLDEKTWSEPVPVQVFGDRDQDMVKLADWDAVKPDLDPILKQAHDLFTQPPVPADDMPKGILNVQYEPESRTYIVRSQLSEKTKNSYLIWFDDKGQISKKQDSRGVWK